MPAGADGRVRWIKPKPRILDILLHVAVLDLILLALVLVAIRFWTSLYGGDDPSWRTPYIVISIAVFVFGWFGYHRLLSVHSDCWVREEQPYRKTTSPEDRPSPLALFLVRFAFTEIGICFLVYVTMHWWGSQLGGPGMVPFYFRNHMDDITGRRFIPKWVPTYFLISVITFFVLLLCFELIERRLKRGRV
jgi:hypothetical protein